jgi:CDP-glucose 4,6-dehydratase
MKKFKIFKNKKILITGHNGFKGSWLSIWLSLLGAKVIGVSLKNKNSNNHFNLVKKKLNMKSFYCDIRNKKKIEKIILTYKPDFVFHLAAQSLVYKSILNPSFTWETNVIGLLNVLETLNKLKKQCITVIVTSDKCYKNVEQKKGYK